jgi:DNA replication protein DnaC
VGLLFEQLPRQGTKFRIVPAILDRLLHRSHVLNIKGRSYRLRDLEDALKG